MSDVMLQVGGMGCRRCVREVTARLRDVPGVVLVAVVTGRERVLLTGSMSVPAVLAALAGTPYRVRVLPDRDGTEAGQAAR